MTNKMEKERIGSGSRLKFVAHSEFYGKWKLHKVVKNMKFIKYLGLTQLAINYYKCCRVIGSRKI